jgi:hypothetical protein
MQTLTITRAEAFTLIAKSVEDIEKIRDLINDQTTFGVLAVWSRTAMKVRTGLDVKITVNN